MLKCQLGDILHILCNLLYNLFVELNIIITFTSTQTNNIMKLTITIIKGQIETIEGIENIVETLYYEGIEEAILNDGNTILVYGNGTYEIINK